MQSISMKGITRRHPIKSFGMVSGALMASAFLAAIGVEPATPIVSDGTSPTPATVATSAESKASAAGDRKLVIWTAKLFTEAANEDAAKKLKGFAQEKQWEIDLCQTPTDMMPKLLAVC